MRLLRLWTAALVAASAAPAAVDPGLLDLVMPDAKVLAGIQVQHSLASPFGQHLLTQIPSNDGAMKFATATGLDVRRDLREILFASVGGPANGGSQPPGLILVRGTFQPDRFLTLATLIGSSIVTESGVAVITPPQTAARASLAFLNPTTLAIGDRASLKAAIERYVSHASYTSALAQRAQQASGSRDAWITTLTPLTQLMQGATPPPPPLLQSLGAATASVQFEDTAVAISGELATASEQDARSMTDAIRFLAGMIQANKNQNPQAAQAAALLANARFTADGTTVRVDLTVPEREMEEIFILPGAKPKQIAGR